MKKFAIVIIAVIVLCAVLLGCDYDDMYERERLFDGEREYETEYDEREYGDSDYGFEYDD